MGYRRQRKVFLLRFEDEPGLEVYAYSAPLGVVLGLVDMVPEKASGLKDIAVLDDLLATFGESLKEWNLEDEDGQPIGLKPTQMKACGPDGSTVLETEIEAKVRALKTQDLDFVLELILAWIEAVVSVGGPLKQRSSGGDQSPEESIPMAVQ